MTQGSLGFGPGDSFLFVSTLTNKTDGSKAGSVHGQCTVQVGKWLLCQAGAFLGDQGEISVSGLVSSNASSFDIPVTGGTGVFDNVRGTVHIDQVSDTVSTDTFNLLP